MSTLTLAGRVLAIEEALARGAPCLRGCARARLLRRTHGRPSTSTSTCSFPRSASPTSPAPLARLGAAADDPAIEAIARRDGQVRVMWDATPIDLFFAYDAFHEAAAAARQAVPFADGTIPILAADHLVVCKVIYNRPRDWVDIEAVLAAGADVRAAEVLRWVARIAGDEDPRYERIAAVLTRG